MYETLRYELLHWANSLPTSINTHQTSPINVIQIWRREWVESEEKKGEEKSNSYIISGWKNIQRRRTRIISHNPIDFECVVSPLYLLFAVDFPERHSGLVWHVTCLYVIRPWLNQNQNQPKIRKSKKPKGRESFFFCNRLFVVSILSLNLSSNGLQFFLALKKWFGELSAGKLLGYHFLFLSFHFFWNKELLNF